MVQHNFERPKVRAFVRQICPDLSDKELAEAEDNFARYLEILMRMCQRIEQEEKEQL